MEKTHRFAEEIERLVWFFQHTFWEGQLQTFNGLQLIVILLVAGAIGWTTKVVIGFLMGGY